MKDLKNGFQWKLLDIYIPFPSIFSQDSQFMFEQEVRREIRTLDESHRIHLKFLDDFQDLRHAPQIEISTPQSCLSQPYSGFLHNTVHLRPILGSKPGERRGIWGLFGRI